MAASGKQPVCWVIAVSGDFVSFPKTLYMEAGRLGVDTHPGGNSY